jgi:hypothetical protein
VLIPDIASVLAKAAAAATPPAMNMTTTMNMTNTTMVSRRPRPLRSRARPAAALPCAFRARRPGAGSLLP